SLWVRKSLSRKEIKKMAIRKKGTHAQPINTKKQLNKKTVIKNKKTINKKVVKNNKLFIIEQINKLLKELE
uniref:hypothetical protein n=1 Tax=Vaccinium witches'-broom phytoplasma TaxID=85642 RepID=UPI001C9D6DD9